MCGHQRLDRVILSIHDGTQDSVLILRLLDRFTVRRSKEVCKLVNRTSLISPILIELQGSFQHEDPNVTWHLSTFKLGP